MVGTSRLLDPNEGIGNWVGDNGERLGGDGECGEIGEIASGNGDGGGELAVACKGLFIDSTSTFS